MLEILMLSLAPLFRNQSMDNRTDLVSTNVSTFRDYSSSIIAHQNCTPPPSAPTAVNIISYCYVLPTVCAIGILGNIANLITLASGRLKAVSYMYLRGLGIADMLCMIFVLIFVSFEIISASPNYGHYLTLYGVVWYKAHLMLPLINWTVTAGILIVLALTLERYISIAWPILFREWNSPRRAIIIMAAAYVSSIILYLPMCWQSEVVPMCSSPNSKQNSSLISLFAAYPNANLSLDDDLTNYTIAMHNGWTYTDNKLLLNSASYSAYKFTRETVLKVLPMVMLTFLNLQIIIAFKKVRTRRRRLNTSANQNTREQKSLLFLLAGIVVLFFICNIPAAINLVFITEAMKRKKNYIVFRVVANF